jgi:hypothetical protein
MGGALGVVKARFCEGSQRKSQLKLRKKLSRLKYFPEVDKVTVHVIDNFGVAINEGSRFVEKHCSAAKEWLNIVRMTWH